MEIYSYNVYMTPAYGFLQGGFSMFHHLGVCDQDGGGEVCVSMCVCEESSLISVRIMEKGGDDWAGLV